jgi:SAM-dependent methyltransferase
MQRIVEPEWLDELPPTDAAAVSSRSDLRRLNVLMQHARVIQRELRKNPVTKRICDIGCGDGTLMLEVARRLPWRDVHLTLLDRKPVVTHDTCAEFGRIGWRVNIVEQDVHAAFADSGKFDAVTANLFLHHFPPDTLAQLLQGIAKRCSSFAAVEPRRGRFPLVAAASVGVVGCGPVTRHDAVASVRAGFRRREISALWPSSEKWILSEKPCGLFSHLFVARRG